MHDSSTDDRKASRGYCLWSVIGPGHAGRQDVNRNSQALNMLNCTLRA
jgi:hypothetical protein